MHHPLITVIIPCFNSERYVESAIRSIINQTYSHLEIIVIDDGSTDNTKSILTMLSQEDKRILYIENKINLGLSKTLNKGICLANGDYIARMDADDISLPDRLEKQLRFLEKNQDIDIVSSNIEYIDEHHQHLAKQVNLPLSHRQIIQKLAINSPLVHPAVLAKTTFFKDLGGFDESITYAEDYELWIRGWLYGKHFANLAEKLVYYRIHSHQMTQFSYNERNEKSIRTFLMRHFKDTGNVKFLLGYILHTKVGYYFKNRIKSLIE